MQNTVLERELEAAGFTNQDNFEATIDQAMQIAGVLKVADLSEYIPYGDGSLSEDIFLRMKEMNRTELAKLIKENILDKAPKKYSSIQPKEHAVNIVNSFKKIRAAVTKELNEAIDQAMKKVKTDKELDLCFYIPHEGKRLHHFTYARLRAEQPKILQTLINDHILTKEPQKYVKTYKSKSGKTSLPLGQEELTLEDTIKSALKRKSLGLQKEEDICRYIPSGKYFLHPMAFRSLKKKDPANLKSLIEEYVLKPKSPVLIEWKRQEPSSLLQQDQKDSSIQPQPSKQDTSTSDSNKMAQLITMMAKLIGEIQEQKIVKTKEDTQEDQLSADESLLSLSREYDSNRYLRTIQNQLIKRIRQREVDYELWDIYVDLINEL